MEEVGVSTSDGASQYHHVIEDIDLNFLQSERNYLTIHNDALW